MFLSNAALSVIAFFSLFNVLYLYSPIESGEVGRLYKTCDECLKSECHAENKRPCYTRWDNDEGECNKGCTDETMECACDSACYMWVPKEGFDKTNLTPCYGDIEDPLCL
ncbi:unnamed protein product [Macrosiphum euphorbiae]|uniref:Uncharacterized protein n=1 Tax=Macrosiphum euphorbiae TaxID=13131 RepID=A0AAV0VU80_9HEMI|nr:unnamed protein product [Macrosiphum euphorbiae]